MKPLSPPQSPPAPGLGGHADIDWAQPACANGLCCCPEALAGAMSRKYAALCALRRSHDALGRAPLSSLTASLRRARRAQLAQLAAQFPGALRELERLEAPALDWRRCQAEYAVGAGCVPRWLRLVWDYHALWHRGLAFRRFARTHSLGPPGAGGDAPQALAPRFASWYERAVGHTPHMSYACVGAGPQTHADAVDATWLEKLGLRQAVWAQLTQRYGCDATRMSEVLWGAGSWAA